MWLEGDSLKRTLMLQSPRARRALCGVVLATYRVELTALLSRMASGGVAAGDAAVVHDLARRIANTAGTVHLRSVEHEATTLQRRASAAQRGGGKAEGAMLVAGLRVVDHILAAAPIEAAQGSAAN